MGLIMIMKFNVGLNSKPPSRLFNFGIYQNKYFENEVLYQTAEKGARFITILPNVAPNFRRALRYRPGYRRPVVE